MPIGPGIYNEFDSSLMRPEDRDRVFAYMQMDKDGELWLVDLDDWSVKIKLETMEDVYTFLAKKELSK